MKWWNDLNSLSRCPGGRQYSGAFPEWDRLITASNPARMEEPCQFMRATLVCLLALPASGIRTSQTGNADPVKATSPNGEITILLFDAGAQTGKMVSTGGWSALRGRVPRQTADGTGAELGRDLVGLSAPGPGMHLLAMHPESVDATYLDPGGQNQHRAQSLQRRRAPISKTPPGRKVTIEAYRWSRLPLLRCWIKLSSSKIIWHCK